MLCSTRWIYIPGSRGGAACWDLVLALVGLYIRANEHR
jgi:hypothetical protein